MANNYNKEVGERIHSIRKKRKLSMKELGLKVGLHESTVSRYEKGDIKSLDIDMLKEFANALGVSSQYITGWDDANTYKKYFDEIEELGLTNNEMLDLVAYAKFLKLKRSDK